MPAIQYGDFYVTLDLGRAYGYAGEKSDPIRISSYALARTKVPRV